MSQPAAGVKINKDACPEQHECGADEVDRGSGAIHDG